MTASMLSRNQVAIAAGLGAVLALAGVSAASAAEPESYKVKATYKVTLNSFHVGTLRYVSTVDRGHYTAESRIDLSAMFGAVSWKGAARSTGTLGKDGVRPASYRFEFDGVGSSGAVDMGFTKGTVAALLVHPAPPRTADLVPVKGQHLEGVLDPLSAILSLAHSGSSNPCGRKVAIFDGQQRFTLELHARRRAAAAGVTAVCRVKYRPIAGYRNNAETKAMSRNTGIEIAFQQDKETGLAIPYSITVPLAVGPIGLQVQEIDIETPDNRRIALANGPSGW